MKIQKLIKVSAILFLILVSLAGCNKKANERPANLEEIYSRDGVPVRVQRVESQEFTKTINYNTSVSGLRETPVYSVLSDKVVKINARIGDSVRQDDVIIQFPENNMQANYFQAKAAYNLAVVTWERMQNLFKTGGISQQDLDGAETQFRVSQANWDAVQQAVNVKAPITGILTDINVREMQKVNPGDYLFTVSRLDRLFGRLWITEDDIAYVKNGANVIFSWNGIERQGRIQNVALSLNRDFNAFSAEVIIDNSDLKIKSGVTGSVAIDVYSNREAVVIPRNIVQTDRDDKVFVYVAKNSLSEKRFIELGNESDLYYEVVSGLNTGDLLIVEGLQLIQDSNTKLLIR